MGGSFFMLNNPLSLRFECAHYCQLLPSRASGSRANRATSTPLRVRYVLTAITLRARKEVWLMRLPTTNASTDRVRDNTERGSLFRPWVLPS